MALGYLTGIQQTVFTITDDIGGHVMIDDSLLYCSYHGLKGALRIFTQA